jgi:hypothetical protein
MLLAPAVAPRLYHHVGMLTHTLTIDDLPNEILLLIFIRGCEELPSDDCEFRPRDLKSFAGLSRTVNRRWKTLIDLNPNNNWSFWIARLCLDVAHCPEDRVSSGPLDPTPFAKRLARFIHQLLTSQGCDLEIIFILPRSNAWFTPLPSLSRISSITLKLLLYAMEYISPYRNQISLLRVLGNQPHVHLHFLRIIKDGTWTKAPRLNELSFVQTSLPRVHRKRFASWLIYPTSQRRYVAFWNQNATAHSVQRTSLTFVSSKLSLSRLLHGYSQNFSCQQVSST